MGVASTSKVSRKVEFRMRLETLLSQYSKFVLINADHVGSKQLQMIRQSLRGKAEILMGKNVRLFSLFLLIKNEMRKKERKRIS